MIIWLASYPKSGNTWVRSFLNSLIFSGSNQLDLNNIAIDQFPNRRHFKDLNCNLDDFKEIAKNWINAQNKIIEDKKIKFLKTHNMLCSIDKNSFTNTKNTLGVIHVIRDPRNVITSVKNHFSEESYSSALNFLFDEFKFMGRGTVVKKEKYNENDVMTLIASWQIHYNSWKIFPKNYYQIKYENLIDDPEKEFFLLCDYLTKITKINFNKEKIFKSIELNMFDNLKKAEIKQNFIETVKNKKTNEKIPFFNLGKNNNWKTMLDEKIKDEIEKKFYKEMKELNYL